MITGWLIRLVVVFVVIAVVLFDAGSAIVNFFSLDSKAEEIAVSLATAVTNDELPTDNPQILKDRAKDLAQEAGAHLVRAEMGADGVIFVRLRRKANTLVLGKVSALERWTRATADARTGSS